MLRPPVGVAILGFLAILAGVADLLIGFRLMGWVAFGPGEVGSGLFFWGLLAAVTGGIYIAAGVALWATQPWAWVFTWIMAILGLFNAVLVLLGTGDLASGIAAALLPFVTLWYVNQEDIKAVFGIHA